jgi:hypothetical protein
MADTHALQAHDVPAHEAHDAREQRPDDAGDEREDKVHRADVLMVRRIDVTAPAGDVTMMFGRPVGGNIMGLERVRIGHF